MEKSFLSTHMRNHTGELPYKCKICKLDFKMKQDLRDHQELVHNDVKSFACMKCSACFSKYNALKVHQKIHTGQKPYTCPFPGCGKSFVEKGNMKTHFKIHVNIIFYLQDNFVKYLDLIDDTAFLKTDNKSDDCEENNNEPVKEIVKEMAKELQNKPKIPEVPLFPATNPIPLRKPSESESLNNNILSYSILLRKMQEFSNYLDGYASNLIFAYSFYSHCKNLNLLLVLELNRLIHLLNSDQVSNSEVKTLMEEVLRRLYEGMVEMKPFNTECCLPFRNDSDFFTYLESFIQQIPALHQGVNGK